MMGINVTKARIPVVFELNDDSDSRFKKVKVWIAHTGENLNNSYFSKETLQNMIGTLAKIPIVGYIEIDEDGNEDFSDHRQEITIKSGEGVDIRYAGHAYGFIPEEHNAQFEFRDGKEWLTAEGYIWTKFKDAMEIFNSDNGVKSHSMEITEAEGEVDDIGRMVISSAVFSALCILGEDVSPAMTGSTVEFYSEKKNQYQFELNEMFEEFEKEKGELDLPENNDNLENTNPEIKDEITEDDTSTNGDSKPENESVEDEISETETVSEAEAETETEETETPDETEEDGEQIFSINENKVTLNFQLSHEDQRLGLYKALNGRLEDGYHYILDMYNDHAIVEEVVYDSESDSTKERVLRINFGVENDDISIGEVGEVFPMYLTQSEKEVVQAQREEIESLNSRLEELSDFKEKSELTAKEQLVSEYESELDKDVVENIRENFSKMSVEDVEKEVALEFFKKNQAEKKENDTSVTVQNFSASKEKKFGTLDKYFK